MIVVVDRGLRTLVEDRGRFGMRALGLGSSGCFDPLAALAANAAVGNDPDGAVFEAAIGGPALRFETGGLVAWTGATGAEVTVAGVPLAPGVPTAVAPGETVRLGRIRDGLRAWLAVRGGVDAPSVLGSRSTHVAGGVGPAPLRVGDAFGIGSRAVSEPRNVRLPVPADAVRFVPATVESPFEATVTPQSDRTGIRFTDASTPARLGAEADPEPLLVGTIQVPPDGNPIVLGPDGPATGGYLVAGVVARADLGILAQAKPGARLRFMPVSREDARRAWEDALRCLAPST